MARYIDADARKEHLEDFSKWCKDGRKQGVDFWLKDFAFDGFAGDLDELCKKYTEDNQ